MNYIKTFFLLGILTSLFIFIGFSLGGQKGALIALLITAAMNFFAYYNSSSLVLKMHNAKEASKADYPLFYDIVEELILHANLPMPKLYILQESTPNAFATGRNTKNSVVAVTQGLLDLLTKNELKGVIAHELAHIKNSDILISTIAGIIAGSISMLGNMFMFANLFGSRGSDEREGGGNPILAIIMMVVAPLIAMILQMAVSRQREYAADKLGGQICKNPLYLASALSKLNDYSKSFTQKKQEQNQATAHLFIINYAINSQSDSLFSTHPNTFNRIAQLQEQAKLMNILDDSNSINNSYTKDIDNKNYKNFNNNPWS
jgi:heat shock protein HtpX